MVVRMISRRMDPRSVVIKMIDGSVIRGQVNLYHEETQYNRISDLIARGSEPFLVVFGVTVEEKPDQVIIVNKRNILWAAPEEEADASEESI